MRPDLADRERAAGSQRRGQLSLELLMDVLIVMSLIGIALAALQQTESKTGRQRMIYAQQLELEEEARAIDVLGQFRWAAMEINRSYQIDSYHLRVQENGQLIEVKTLYGERYDLEPV